MHIPDMVLAPQVSLTTGILAVAGFGLSLRRLERGLGERTTVLMGIMASFVFAAQMVNFPVGPFVSGHLLGGVLAAVMLGPWAGAVVIGAVLIVQCLLFADGGMTALGANFLNMGLIGSICGYVLYAPLRRAFGGRAGVLIAAMIAAWFSVILSAGAFAVELACSGHWADFPRILGWMTLVHAAIGVGEAVITGLAVRFILLTRPDLIHNPDAVAPSHALHQGQLILAGLGVALAVALFLAPFAWDRPDGLEFVGRKLGFLKPAPPVVASSPVSVEGTPGLFPSLGAAPAVAGAIGTLVVFALALGLSRVFPRLQPKLRGGAIETPEMAAQHAA